MGTIYNKLITEPLGWIIWAIYKLVQNYGLTIIIFTVVVKILLMPLQVKSQKAMKKQQKIQPIIAELKKKYANDQQKMQTEMMKVYKENGVSMTGGCLPLLIQFPILFTLYHVIQRPLTYISCINFTDLGVASHVETIVKGMTEKLPYTDLDKIFSNCQIQLSTWADKLGHADFGWHINFNFLGLDLSGVPSSGFSAMMRGDYSDMGTVLLVLIPVFAVLATWFSMKQSQKMTQGTAANNSDAPSMGKSMNVIMPIMTGFFTFTFASGIGLYWIASSVMQIVQQYVLDKYLDKKEDDFVVKVPEKNGKNGKKRRRS